MQPNGEHNQQGPSGPPNFPPPGVGYTKPGPFSGPNQTRNLLMVAAAVIVLAVVVIASVAACSSSDSSTTGQQHNSGDGAPAVAPTTASASKPTKLDASLLDGLRPVEANDFTYVNASPMYGWRFRLSYPSSIVCEVSPFFKFGKPEGAPAQGLLLCTSMGWSRQSLESVENPVHAQSDKYNLGPSSLGWVSHPNEKDTQGGNIEGKPQSFQLSPSSGNELQAGTKATFNIAKQTDPPLNFTCGNTGEAVVCVNDKTRHGFGATNTTFQVW